MSAIYLAANQVLGTAFGHLQFVFDPDDTLDSGDELEFEVQPTAIIGESFWDVSPEQAFEVPDDALTRVSSALDLEGRAAEDVWALLQSARDFFAKTEVEYHLGLSGEEGQNSNTYVTTVAHIVDLKISDAVGGFLDTEDFSAFPGEARNVLFDLIAQNGPNALRLDVAGTNASETLFGGAGRDVINGSGGNDRLLGAGSRDVMSGDGGRDKLFGGAGGDTLNGGGGRDRLLGQKGSDSLDGDNGNDRLFGQAGADRLEGGVGNDILSGGKGRDVFLFNPFDNEGRDTILDFEIGRDLLSVQAQRINASGDENALITLFSGTEIELVGVSADQVSNDIFAFYVVD